MNSGVQAKGSVHLWGSLTSKPYTLFASLQSGLVLYVHESMTVWIHMPGACIALCQLNPVFHITTCRGGFKP